MIEHIIVDLERTAKHIEREYPELTKAAKTIRDETIKYVIKGDQSNLGKLLNWLSSNSDDHPHEVKRKQQ